MKQNVNDFISGIRNLKNVIGSFLFIEDFAQENNCSENDLNDLDRSHHCLQAAHNELIKTINKFFIYKPESELDKKITSSSQISTNINSAISLINNIKQPVIPAKDELLEILNSCSVTFLESNLFDVFLALHQDRSTFREQILFLGDICEEELLSY